MKGKRIFSSPKASATAINADGGILGRHVEFTTVADDSAPTQPVTAAQAIVSSGSRPDVVIPGDSNSTALPILPIFAKAKIPAMSLATAAETMQLGSRGSQRLKKELRRREMSPQAFSITAMAIGAEIGSFTPGDENEPGVRDALYSAWLDHGVLLFRGISTTEQHLSLSQCFGELEIHPFPEVRSKENPAFIDIGGGTGPAFVYDDRDLRSGRLAWHRDTAYTPFVCKGAMLRMLQPSQANGETLFADTAKAYDELPVDVRERIDNLEYKASLRLGPFEQTGPGATWTSVRAATADEAPTASHGNGFDHDEVKARYPAVVHPLVYVHPESGRKCLMLSPTYVDHFIGLDQTDSDELLTYLATHMVQHRYVYRHHWTPDDVIVWDNRRMMHAAAGVTPGDMRHGLRTTLAGQVNCGRYFDSTVTSTHAALVD